MRIGANQIIGVIGWALAKMASTQSDSNTRMDRDSRECTRVDAS
jgi:hypothetical protein